MKALVFQDKVVDLHTEGFPVHKDWVWVDCVDTVKMGDLYGDGVFTSPAPIFTPIQLLRKNRNALLVETDWMAFKDVTLTTAWKTYRQKLRDLPATANPTLDENDQLINVTWPTKPE